MSGEHDVVLAELVSLCSLLERSNDKELSLRVGRGTSVVVEWVERRTPLLCERYAASGVPGDPHWGTITISQKLPQRVLRSDTELRAALDGVCQRVELMESAARAYNTAVEVLADRETRFGSDDDMHRLVSWAALAYWANASTKEPSLLQYYSVVNEISDALQDRYNDGVRNAWALELDGRSFAGPVVESGGSVLLPFVDRESCVPRPLKERVVVAISEAALTTAGFR